MEMEPPVVPSGSKRQRKPSVRLGDLGYRPKDPKRPKRPKPLPLAPIHDNDSHVNNNNIEDPNSMAMLRVSDSEDPSLVQSEEENKSEETKSEPLDQNRDFINQNGGSGLNEIGHVHDWLGHLGLQRYGPVFDIHEIDMTVLPLLTLEDLKDMGISAVGSRRKLYCAIKELNNNDK